MPMIDNSPASYIRYLASKRTVDDRALNARVFRALQDALRSRPREVSSAVLETGAGIGTMIERALEWQLLENADYTAVDRDAELVNEMIRRLTTRPDCTEASEDRRTILLKRENATVAVRPVVQSLEDVVADDASRGAYDVVIANAFLDLTDIGYSVPGLLSRLKPGGIFYFTINFDGGTTFTPLVDAHFDREVERVYHQTMDDRTVAGRSTGASMTGRLLFEALRTAGGIVESAGSSDWVVFPRGGRYPYDEEYFLRFIVHTIHEALKTRPEIDRDRLDQWVDERYAQIERGELTYIAHQLDFFGRVV